LSCKVARHGSTKRGNGSLSVFAERRASLALSGIARVTLSLAALVWRPFAGFSSVDQTSPLGSLPTSSTLRPDFTESGAVSRISSSSRAKSSSTLISSQLSRFSPRRGFSLTRCQRPPSL
jgi:hypothetical protein